MPPPLNDVRHERLGLAARLLGVPSAPHPRRPVHRDAPAWPLAVAVDRSSRPVTE
ncbi:hypothetical protein AB0J14_31295 [Micromonospora arborensis]|uniref:hypothetical protein n=1 Tax=Micromonospora arborensis TaxID=2116518 RepID=UPI0033EA6B29